jgi:hypothetical protein
LSTTENGNSNFVITIIPSWGNYQPNSLWQNQNGLNNPCPNGFRVPSLIEFKNEIYSWSQTNLNGAKLSFLKIGASGWRSIDDGLIMDDNLTGAAFFWTKTLYNQSNSFAWVLTVGSENFSEDFNYLSFGYSVRCIKDYPASIGSIDTIGSSNQGILYSGQSSNNVSTTLYYKNGNGALYDALAIQSTGVTGLTATLSAGNLNNGDGSLQFIISGTPSATGTANFSITIGGKNIVFSRTVNTLTIGSYFGGGIVFYLDSTNIHGLICGLSSIGNYEWGCDNTNVGWGTSINFGKGLSNTQNIIAACSGNNVSARVVRNSNINGFSDWFLPSVGELLMIKQNLSNSNIGPTGLFWSSTEDDQRNAKRVLLSNNINNNPVSYDGKVYSNPVLPVRAF